MLEFSNMEAALAVMIKQGRDALSRLPSLRASLEVLHARSGTDNWYTDLLYHLRSEVLMAYSMLEVEYPNRNNQYAITFPSLFAWRARNILELSIWISYCITDKEGA